MVEADHQRIRREIMFAQLEAEPFAKMITRIRMAERPTYELSPDGFKLVSDGLSDTEHEMIRQCQESIDCIYRRCKYRITAETPLPVVAPFAEVGGDLRLQTIGGGLGQL